jgi:hypothetical protein
MVNADVDFVLLGKDNPRRKIYQPLAHVVLSQGRFLGHIDR